MRKRTYIRRYYPMGLLIMLIFACIIMGCILAMQITVEQRLIDTAVLGVSGGALQGFLLAMA